MVPPQRKEASQYCCSTRSCMFVLCSTVYIQHQQLSFLYHTMPTTSRIPSVRTRLQQREPSKRKSPDTSIPMSGVSVGAVSLPPRVGIYDPILRGRHSKSLQASILRTHEHQPSKNASGCVADEDHDQNNHYDFEDSDAKLVSTRRLLYLYCCCC
jgi:hypothetical protein